VSGLFGLLGMAARSLDAQRFGLDVTGHNIANVNTPGYTRRTPLLSEVPPRDGYSAGDGVRIAGVRADRNRFVDRRLLAEFPAEQREGAIADILSAVELAVGESGSSIDQRLAEFFDAFARLAEMPTSSVNRQEVILQGTSLGAAFADVGARLSAAQAEADGRVRATVEQVNTLARRLAAINKALGSLTPGSGEELQLQDQAKLAVEQLSRLTSVEVLDQPTGGFDVSVAGRPLVAGDDAFELTVTARPGTGFAEVVAFDGGTITGLIGGGTLGGLVQARDTLVPQYRASLDELAYSVASEVNALHAAGFDLNGQPGAAFFQPPAATAGASASLAVNPALRASGGEALVAASGDPAASGDNGVARALARLRDERVLSGGTATFSDYWAQLVYATGRDLQTAREEQQNRAELVRQVEALRDSASGVSLDEEAANLMRFQRAYEANARFFETVNSSLDTLMEMVRA
jgi:flagellar hook-associated protein 1 FlgK